MFKSDVGAVHIAARYLPYLVSRQGTLKVEVAALQQHEACIGLNVTCHHGQTCYQGSTRGTLVKRRGHVGRQVRSHHDAHLVVSRLCFIRWGYHIRTFSVLHVIVIRT